MAGPSRPSVDASHSGARWRSRWLSQDRVSLTNRLSIVCAGRASEEKGNHGHSMLCYALTVDAYLPFLADHLRMYRQKSVPA